MMGTMEIVLDPNDLAPEYQTLPVQSVLFGHLTDPAKAVVKLVGHAMYFSTTVRPPTVETTLPSAQPQI